MSENNNLDIRSEDFREIIGSTPNWIIRSTISVILLVIIILLIGSYFYKYPDFINGRITILSENPPIPIVARSSGKLQYLMVTNGQPVKSGLLVGVIENTADFQDVLSLKILLDSISPVIYTFDKLANIIIPVQLNLGSNQNFYSAFISQWYECLNFIQLDYFGQQMKSLSAQIFDYTAYLDQLKEQTEVLGKELDLNSKQLLRDSTLYVNGVMTEMQYEQSQAGYLKQKYGYKNAISNLYNTQIKINQLKQQILELKIQKNEQENRLFSILKERCENLIAQINAWQQTYILKAPIDGIITFTDLWAEYQQIEIGSTIFTIVPEEEQKIIGKLVIPIIGSGKVELGQKVNIKLDNFPFMEYGLIEGVITNISMVPVMSQNSGYYLAEVHLPEGLKTNYNKDLPFSQEMQGTVEIITKDRRLIERLVAPLISIFKKNV